MRHLPCKLLRINELTALFAIFGGSLVPRICPASPARVLGVFSIEGEET
jgi:hypothetical protein